MSTSQETHQRNGTDFSTAESEAAPSTIVESPTVSVFTNQPIHRGLSTDSNDYGFGSDFGEDPAVIPPKHPYRTLVLCFDGTGDQFDQDNSNIVSLFRMLKKDDRSQQMVYYQAGIGTYVAPQTATPLMTKFSKALDEAVAWNLHAHVMGGYEFLMQNYVSGDRICLFGFSRGAYTARSLAGMIHKVGILPACNHQQVPFAYKMFTRTDELGWAQSNAFKKTFSIDVDIEFIGVWDTVNSVGLIPKRLPFTTSNTIVRTFRHAVSLDERRSKFKANLWNRPNDHEKCFGAQAKAAAEGPDHGNEQHGGHKGNDAHPGQHNKRKNHKQLAMEAMFSKDRSLETDIDEVWFAGCHCDVGGGSVSNEVDTALARIPLRWMIRECFKTNTGIMFHRDALQEAGLDPDSLYPFVKPRPAPLPLGDARIQDIPAKVPKPPKLGKALAVTNNPKPNPKTEEELDLEDAMAPIYDQLSLKWIWWLLEFLPLKHKYQRGDNSWTSYFGWNLGRGRIIPKQKVRGARVHRTVKMRLEARESENGTKYVPKANLNLDHAIWVD